MIFLTAVPLWLVGILLIGLTTLIAGVGPVIVRSRVGLDQLRTNNEVAGFKFASVGVLYAVLLGFAVIVVWGKFSDAENNVALEAGAAATIYRIANGSGGEPGDELREGITGYLKAAITEDWPAMERGKESPITTRALDNVYAGLLRYNPTDRRGEVLLAEALHQLDLVTQARRARLVVSFRHRPWDLVVGAIHRRHPDHRIHALFRHRESPSPNDDDGSIVHSNLFWAPDHYCHRPSICRLG